MFASFLDSTLLLWCVIVGLYIIYILIQGKENWESVEIIIQTFHLIFRIIYNCILKVLYCMFPHVLRHDLVQRTPVKITWRVNGVAVATRAGLTTTTTVGATAVVIVPVATRDVTRVRVAWNVRGVIRSAAQITVTPSGRGTDTAVRRVTAEDPATVITAGATVITAASAIRFTVPACARGRPDIL